MTIEKIIKINDFLERTDKVSGFFEMDSFANELKAYFGNDFDLKLKVYPHNTVESYNDIFNKNDCASIKAFLQSQLDKNPTNEEILKIIKLIDKGLSVKGKNYCKDSYVCEVYNCFSDGIDFGDNIKKIANNVGERRDPYQILDIANDGTIEAIIFRLKKYANSLLCGNKEKLETEKIVIQNINTNTNNNYNKNENKIDINIVIENAKKEIEELALADKQTKEVIEKLDAIKKIIEGKESKKGKWEKIKSVFKWVIEQGIQVANVIVPILPNMFS